MKMITRLLWIIIIIAIGLATVSFSISNDAPVKLALWPFEAKVTLPLWLVCIISLGVGLLLGSTFIWLQMIAIRARKWHLQQNFNKLEKKYAALIKTRSSETKTDTSDTSGTSGGTDLIKLLHQKQTI